MTERIVRSELERAAAAAARATDGVAFLRPGLTGLLRAAATSATGSRYASPPEGVRALRNSADGSWDVELRLTVRRGHRAADVTRAVRLAVEMATRPVVQGEDGTGGGQVSVTAIVTGIV
ncbi:Asp23/Gls24 family envelope stress response protein [Streptomyces zaomyceticus]|uniref:Asp23/Gls24 family envelope stress response protein n=1 Tax=Streptomyces zaomyceticus TaxID=68286 RepID=UPI00167A1EB3|nr:Asp23/Gls24 family envelope stress response protein [Streptomyces zaomyceticus]GHG00419.1 hypothetical protein GCM10018791_09650 [Streptomyces zaomyceticus]